MEVYAGMIDYMDQSIGRVLQHLREIDEYDNTLIVFMSDNGPSKTAILDYIALGGEAAEYFEQFDNSLENRGRPGSSTDIGPGWAYASATPLRLFKGYVAQGGIRVPLIVKPAGSLGQVRRVDTVVHVMDLVPTILELAGVHQPAQWHGVEVAPIQGRSLVTLLEGDQRPRLDGARSGLGGLRDGCLSTRSLESTAAAAALRQRRLAALQPGRGPRRSPGCGRRASRTW